MDGGSGSGCCGLFAMFGSKPGFAKLEDYGAVHDDVIVAGAPRSKETPANHPHAPEQPDDSQGGHKEQPMPRTGSEPAPMTVPCEKDEESTGEEGDEEEEEMPSNKAAVSHEGEGEEKEGEEEEEEEEEERGGGGGGGGEKGEEEEEQEQGGQRAKPPTPNTNQDEQPAHDNSDSNGSNNEVPEGASQQAKRVRLCHEAPRVVSVTSVSSAAGFESGSSGLFEERANDADEEEDDEDDDDEEEGQGNGEKERSESDSKSDSKSDRDGKDEENKDKEDDKEDDVAGVSAGSVNRKVLRRVDSKYGVAWEVQHALSHPDDGELASGEDFSDRSGVSDLEHPDPAALPPDMKTTVQRLREQKRHRRSSVNECIQTFNQNAKKGIALFEERSLLSSAPDVVASFLFEMDGLSRSQVGLYLGSSPDTLRHYVDLFDFKSLQIDDALRVFLSAFQLPGEAQVIDRIMENFARRFVQCNPDSILKESTAYILAFSIIMLNTDLHSRKIKHRMTLAQFVRNSKGVDEGKDFPKAFLAGIYQRISDNELRFRAQKESVKVFSGPQKQGWLTKEGGRIKTKHKRWFILKDACLYYFETPEDPNPKGIVPLEPRIGVRAVGKRSFELYATDGGTLKSNKREADGKVVQGSHANFLLRAKDDTVRCEWIDKLRAAILVQQGALSSARKSVSVRVPPMDLAKRRLSENVLARGSAGFDVPRHPTLPGTFHNLSVVEEDDGSD